MLSSLCVMLLCVCAGCDGEAKRKDVAEREAMGEAAPPVKGKELRVRGRMEIYEDDRSFEGMIPEQVVDEGVRTEFEELIAGIVKGKPDSAWKTEEDVRYMGLDQVGFWTDANEPVVCLRTSVIIEGDAVVSDYTTEALYVKVREWAKAGRIKVEMRERPQGGVDGVIPPPPRE